MALAGAGMPQRYAGLAAIAVETVDASPLRVRDQHL